jgi:hypothetical protein
MNIERTSLSITLSAVAMLGGLAHAQNEEPSPAPVEEVTGVQAVELDNPFLLPGSLESYLAETGQWGSRVEELIEQITMLEQDAAAADALYLDLGNALRRRLDYLRQNMVGARSPLDELEDTPDLSDSISTIAELFARVEAMYAARLRLLEFITPELHLEVTGADVFGAQELSLETSFVLRQIRFQALSIPAVGEDLRRRLQLAPLPIVWGALRLILAIVIFRWWRRWFPETLRRIRLYLMEVKPRTPAVVRRVKLIWYINQLRRPLEWLILFQVFFSTISMPGLDFSVEILAVVLGWILLGWFSVALLNAVAARGDAGLAGEQAILRLRSLRLVAVWLVLVGLGLSLAENLAGVAGIYAWVWRISQILAFPALLILLAWWRNFIFDRLEREQEGAESIDQVLKHRTGLLSYPGAASAAVWLLANKLRRYLIRNVVRLSAEQGFSSGFITQPTESAKDAVDAPPLETIPETLREKLQERTDYYDRFARTERRELVQRAKQLQGGLIAITGERGIGKSSFLAHVKSLINENMILIDCENENYENLLRSLGDALGIKSVTAEIVSERLSATDIHTIAIDNLHRLVRPVIGGQDNLSCFADFIQSITGNVMWLLSADSFAWQFIRSARADRTASEELIQLRSWSEAQITELLDLRNEEAGIEPDFSNTQVPSEFMESSLEDAAARIKTGVYRMIWTLSGGNPSVALRLWADSLSPGENGDITVRTPSQPTTRDLDGASRNVMLVLRVIAQSDLITEQDVAENLRLPRGAVSSAIHYSILRGWIVKTGVHYQLSWLWFRTITRVLARQNMLAR